MKIDRLLAITFCLINKRKVTARELAERFEVSVRTIQRDMDSLCMAGIPIYADRGKDGGYCLIDSFTVNRQYFTQKELTALSSMMSKLSTLLGNAELQTTEDKLLNLIHGKKNSQKHQSLIMDLTPWGVDKKIREKFKNAYQAVNEARVFNIHYASSEGEITQRDIEPLSIVIKGTSWYVHAFCRLRKAIRFFKLTRMIEVKITSQYFNPNIHPPYEEPKQQQNISRSKTLFVLKFAASARGRITDYYHPDSLHFMPDGSTVGIFPFPENEWVYSWILSFGPLIKVLEPPHAKKRIKDMLLFAARSYE